MKVWGVYEDGRWHVATFESLEKARKFVKDYEKESQKILNQLPSDIIGEWPDDIKTKIENLNKKFDIYSELGCNFLVTIEDGIKEIDVR